MYIQQKIVCCEENTIYFIVKIWVGNTSSDYLGGKRYPIVNLRVIELKKTLGFNVRTIRYTYPFLITPHYAKILPSK